MALSRLPFSRLSASLRSVSSKLAFPSFSTLSFLSFRLCKEWAAVQMYQSFAGAEFGQDIVSLRGTYPGI